MPQSEVVVRPPVIPGRYDIIPIHASDVASYKRCRRYWDWSSPTRTNLRRKVSIYGIDTNLWFGTGIHYALEMYYDPILRRDPVEAWLTWYRFQWEGGIVGEEWLDRTYDIHPRLVQGEHLVDIDVGSMTALEDSRQVWAIKGLQEILPDPIEEEFDNFRLLGIGMMEYYKQWSEKNDDFEVVAAESTFSIPLGFESIDRREESPNYGKKLEVHARGKRDAVLWWPSRDVYGINDYKTAQVVGEDYFTKLELDQQVSTYLWATIQEAGLYDLPWYGKVVDRVLYTALRKAYPKPPTPLKSGFPSINRKEESTTPELFRDFLEQEDLVTWYESDEKAQAYYNYLVEQGDKQFVERRTVTRNEHEIASTGKHLRMVAEEMLDPKLNIYPNPTGSWVCLGCQFRPPCIAAEDGSDWKGMLADGYEVNRDR